MLNIDLQVIHSGYDRKTCWVHGRAGMIPTAGDPFSVVLTTHALRLTGSDVFYPMHDMRTDDGGKTWSQLVDQSSAFARQTRPGGVEEGISDFWPMWHEKTQTLLGTGHTIRYIDDVLAPNPRPKDTAYSVYDSTAQTWAPFKTMDTPDDEVFFMEGAGSCQRYDLDNGEILLPTYSGIAAKSSGMHDSLDIAFVIRCGFDGQTLSYIEHGNILTIPTGRGFSEPSLIYFGGRYLMTLRNDDRNYITTSDDGLHFGEPALLTFDDGSELGSYNTQTHWLTVGGALYLVYTRRAEDNDNVIRHRAPLFIAQYNDKRLCVVRETEQVLAPNRGARLGNFGITPINANESWVTVTEWMQTHPPEYWDWRKCEAYGSNNSIFVAKCTPG